MRSVIYALCFALTLSSIGVSSQGWREVEDDASYDLSVGKGPGDRVLVGYFCPTCPSNPDPNKLIRSIHKAYNVIVMAFVGFRPDGTLINQFDCGPQQQFPTCNNKNFTLTREMIKFLQDEGRTVLLSVGGGAGGALDGNAPRDFARTMAQSASKFIDQYGFDGFDWDIEHFVGPMERYMSLMDDVNYLLKKMQPHVLLTAAPQIPHLYPDLAMVVPGWNVYARMASARGSRDIVDWMQVQLYNNFPVDNVNYVKKLIKGFHPVGNGQTYDVQLNRTQIVLGFPATRRAAGSGYVSPQSIVGWVKQLDSEGIRIRGVMTWCVGWDQLSGWSFANVVGKIL